MPGGDLGAGAGDVGASSRGLSGRSIWRGARAPRTINAGQRSAVDQGRASAPEIGVLVVPGAKHGVDNDLDEVAHVAVD
jgi:hypothetical protein